MTKQARLVAGLALACLLMTIANAVILQRGFDERDARASRERDVATLRQQQVSRESTYRGCLRGTLDRADTARIARTARTARLAAARAERRPAERAANLAAAGSYLIIARSLESRARLERDRGKPLTAEVRAAFCRVQFPPVIR